MRTSIQFMYVVLAFILARNSLNAQESTRIYENGTDKLIVYSDVPGFAPSEFYKIRVRSNATNNEWQESFALVTRSLVAQAQEESGTDENYFSHLKDWSHTYNNIEMNSSVEVEISKADGSPITKAAIHPIEKGRDLKIGPDGKVTFFIDNPTQLTIDIDGQMDDQNTGYSKTDGYANDRYDGPPIHAISIFANPIMEKPDTSNANIWMVKAGEDPPTDPDSYSTLYFGPGVHNLGYNFKIYKNRQYYIPGDAIVYGTFNNYQTTDGQNIKIFGLGTISGDKIEHPEYHTDFPYNDASPGNAKPWKPISIERAENVLVEGVCITNPAFHSMALPPSTNKRKVTVVKWVKIISWRGNGDGIGNAHVIEDSFFRTQDDATYIKGDRIRCIFWNDANGASMVMQGISTNFPIFVADCNVIYARAQWHRWNGGRVFSGRPINGAGQKKVNVLFRDIRIEDPRPTLQIFNLHSKDDLPTQYNSPSDDIGESYSGINFQNITAAAFSILGFPEILHGCEQSPYSDLTFENVRIAGKLFTNLNDFSFVNEWVTDIKFNPGITDDATLFDMYLNGISLPEFKPDTENYTIALPAGTEKVPDIRATRFDYDATVTISKAESFSDTCKIIVTAEDGVTTKTYKVNFTLGTDEIINFNSPVQVYPGDTITTTINYATAEPRDIRVFIQLNSPPWTDYGGKTITVPSGMGTIEIKFPVDPEIPLATGAYKIVANLLPIGAAWPDRLDEVILKNIDVVSPYSSDATLSDLSVNGTIVTGFNSDKLNYEIILPAGTSEVPDIIATLNHENAWVEIKKDETLPGSASILVTAEDSTTTQSYTINFIVEELSGLTAPDEVMQGKIISASVDYTAYTNRDIMFILQLSTEPWSEYGRNTITVPTGSGKANIDIVVDANIPVAEDAYEIIAVLLPAEGALSDSLVVVNAQNIDAVSIPTHIESDVLTKSLLEVEVFPNPFTNKLYFENYDKEAFGIFNIRGQKIVDSQLNQEKKLTLLNTRSWIKGVYIMKTASGNTKKLIKY